MFPRNAEIFGFGDGDKCCRRVCHGPDWRSVRDNHLSFVLKCKTKQMCSPTCQVWSRDIRLWRGRGLSPGPGVHRGGHWEALSGYWRVPGPQVMALVSGSKESGLLFHSKTICPKGTPLPVAPTPSAPTVSARSPAPVSLDTSCGLRARAAQTLTSVSTRTGARIKRKTFKQKCVLSSMF